MEHLAIMRKSWGLTQKILTKEKQIESRWYISKYTPWNRICAGDIVYFKDSGNLVNIKASVSKVLQFDNLTPKKVNELLVKYHNLDGIKKEEIKEYFEMFKNKKYCILIFLKNPVSIEPFKIDKKGFGNMASWITIDNIEKIKT